MYTKEQQKEYNKLWYQKNKEYVKEYDKGRRGIRQAENLFKCAKSRAKREGTEFNLEVDDINIPMTDNIVLVASLRIRAQIRRTIPTRKSVQDGSRDRISDLLEQAADEIERQGKVVHTLKEGLVSACYERDHWRANHADQVKRARVLIERTDMPLERIKAYEQFEVLQTEIKKLKESTKLY